jgi:thioredoxin reductase
MLDASIYSLDLAQRPFKLTLNDSKKEIYAHSIVMATGTRPCIHARAALVRTATFQCAGADSRWLGIPGEEELQGFGVSSCATCDGFLFKGLKAVVIGGGDSAMEVRASASCVCACVRGLC